MTQNHVLRSMSSNLIRSITVPTSIFDIAFVAGEKLVRVRFKKRISRLGGIGRHARLRI